MGKIVTNPVEALIDVGRENTELHEEVQRIYRECDWYRGALEFISKMPERSSQVALKALQHRPYKS